MSKSILHLNFETYGSRIPGLIAIPPLHIAVLYYFWQDYAFDVDKTSCTCSCWDTVFKGSYESGVASYKHMYFNATSNTVKIWMAIVVGTIIFYETIRHLVDDQEKAAISMMILFLPTIFSHYYSWWMYINYWNDDFYSQWYHQLFFTITELVSTAPIVHLADQGNCVTYRKALGIVSIAVLHILAGSWDQFVTNVVWGQGQAHQVLRDLGFMIPDVLQVFIPLWCLRQRASYNLSGVDLRSCSFRNDLFFMLGMITVGLCVCALL